MCNLIICLFLQLIDEQEQYYTFLRELKRHPWKNIPSKSDAKIKDPVTHLEEYRSYMAFSFNVDGYLETLRGLENVLDCYNLSTMVNRIIDAKKMHDIDMKLKEIDNKRKLVDMDMDEEKLFKRKSDAYVDAVVAVGSDSSAGEVVATVGEGGNRGATGVAGGGGGATGGGAEGGEGAMGDLTTDTVRLSTVRPPSPAKEEPAAGGEYGGGNGF